MNGARAITAIELHKISEYLQVSMDSLMKMSEKPMDMSVIHSFMGRVKTEEARKGIQLADELSNMILFHAMVCENGKKMEQVRMGRRWSNLGRISDEQCLGKWSFDSGQGAFSFLRKEK